MESEELMKGDWVTYAGTPMRVTGRLIDDLEFNELNHIEREGFEPISITPEILEKNGFHYYRYREDWYKRFVPFTLKQIGNIWQIVNWDINISSVHELQHAFRLCNIDKEIEI